MTEEALQEQENVAVPLAARLEALLYVVDEPLPVKRMADLLGDGMSSQDLTAALQALAETMNADPSRGIKLVAIAGGWQLATKPEHAELIDRFLVKRKQRTLPQPALETLAIAAYKQPITRAEIEAIRGVSAESALHTLLERRLLRLAGRKEVPGRPYMYATTKEFLKYFGLASLQELPKPEDFGAKAAAIEAEGAGAEALAESPEASVEPAEAPAQQ